MAGANEVVPRATDRDARRAQARAQGSSRLVAWLEAEERFRLCRGVAEPARRQPNLRQDKLWYHQNFVSADALIPRFLFKRDSSSN
jgi:hypothetical protein